MTFGEVSLTHYFLSNDRLVESTLLHTFLLSFKKLYLPNMVQFLSFAVAIASAVVAVSAATEVIPESQSHVVLPPSAKNERRAARRTHHQARSGNSYTGIATWFNPATQGGSTGACGPQEGDDSMIVALNAPQYGNMDKKSSWCGKKVAITYKGKTVQATINDACPECASGSLDLTPAVFNQLGDPNIGELDIKWTVI
jgi:expansin (peptidoglycan-binding protein)